MTTTLRSIFLTSENAAQTAKFYQEIAELNLEQIGSPGGYQYWKIDDGNMQLAIHDAKSFSDDTHPANERSNLTHLYFKIADRDRFLTHLKAHAVAPYKTDDVVVTVIDPDGRKVMFGTA